MSDDVRRYAADFDIQSEANRMVLALQFLNEVDLDAICAVVEDAHSIGPFLDPTRYRDALYRGDMDSIAKIADALREPLRLYRETVLSKIPAAPA